jgi:hypothetical protein
MGQYSIATSLLPSAEDATHDQNVFVALVGVHVAPEFVEVKIEPHLNAATSMVPSADEATEVQPPTGAVDAVQVAPESVEV